THRILTPLELLARIAALIPPPRFPLTRFHGVFAPHSAWRARVVPEASLPHCTRPPSAKSEAACDSDASARPPAPRSAPGRAQRVRPGSIALATDTASAPPNDEPSRSPPHHQRRTETHVGRLLDGRLLADAPRVDWARLLSRSLEIDVLTCDACGQTRRLL